MAAAKHRCNGGDRREVVAEQLQVLVMRRDDSSWHPCEISLSSNGLGLNVEFEADGIKEVILTKEEAIELLRIRSDPLQGEDCSLIRQGDRVLATPKSGYSKVFFEAVVEERRDATHSKKRCTCSFMVRWTGQVPGGETTALPLSSLMSMPATRIDIHPAIQGFFSNVSQIIFEEEELLDSPIPSIIEEDGTPNIPTIGEGSSSTLLMQKNIAAKTHSGTMRPLNNSGIVRQLFQDDEVLEEKAEDEAGGSCSNGEGAKRKLFNCKEKQGSRKSSRLNGSLPKKS